MYVSISRSFSPFVYFLPLTQEWNKDGEKLTRIVDSIDDGSVHLDEKHCWILESDLHGLDERIHNSGRELHVTLVNLALRHEPVVARQLADALCSTKEDVRRTRLGQEEEHEQGDGR